MSPIKSSTTPITSHYIDFLIEIETRVRLNYLSVYCLLLEFSFMIIPTKPYRVDSNYILLSAISIFIHNVFMSLFSSIGCISSISFVFRELFKANKCECFSISHLLTEQRCDKKLWMISKHYFFLYTPRM